MALIGREPESHLHLGQAALALNTWAPPFLPPLAVCLLAAAAAAAAHMAVDTTVQTLIHTFVGIEKQASTHDTPEWYLQRKLKHTHMHTDAKYTGGNFPMP